MSEFLTAVLHPERARSAGRPGWLSAVGLVLVPLLIGGLLVWALWQPDERLDRIQAAVVNQDVAVEVNGQTVPLGRQLAAGLVTAGGGAGAGSTGSSSTGSSNGSGSTGAATGSSSGTASDEPTASAAVPGADSPSNFTWVVTGAEDAAAGLADGRYATVVTIPAGFSAAATSVGTDPANPQQATIDIATSERSRPVDAAVAQAVTSVAVQVLSSQLTTTYLENVFLGFDTLQGHLTDAADGAGQLADGATQVGSGATSLASGADQLASGVGQLSSGAASLASGARSLSSGVGQVSSGAAGLASGASALSSGVGQLSSGAVTLAGGLDQLAAGVGESAATAQAGVAPAQQFAGGLDQLATGLAGLAHLSAVCAGTAVDPALPQAAACTALDQQTAPAALAALAGNAAQLASGGHDLADGVSDSATGLDTLAATLGQTAAGAQQLASGASQSASGAASLASGASQLASGASQAASGAASLASGASQLASGASQSASGASQLAGGAGELATGAEQVGSGAGELADGLTTAADQVPAYSSDEAGRLADVVARPVAATGADSGIFGGSSVPFLLVVALWLGGLATFLVLGATVPRVVGSTRSSLRLALTAFVPGAALGLVQGLVLTAAMARALDLTPGGWVAFAAVTGLAGVAFAAVNQGLVAIARGFGRFLSVVVAVVGLATAVVSTVPSLLDQVAAVLPLAPARTAMQGVLTGDGAGGGVALLVVWTLLGIGLTTAAVARRRVVPAGQLARWTRAA